MKWIITALFMLTASVCSAAELGGESEEAALYRFGYRPVDYARVKGVFDGCDFDKVIPLTHKRKFICKTADNSKTGNQSYVSLLKNEQTGDIKVLIDGHEYPGDFYEADGRKVSP